MRALDELITFDSGYSAVIYKLMSDPAEKSYIRSNSDIMIDHVPVDCHGVLPLVLLQNALQRSRKGINDYLDTLYLPSSSKEVSGSAEFQIKTA